ncbi:MAG: sigma-70 family RNA polymerase sigma factor [Puniceicoccaceae bacterium]|nr:MAG: sigma-70 family RNA polymerase sigma factor [Puniceicoccaceae bacterium]
MRLGKVPAIRRFWLRAGLGLRRAAVIPASGGCDPPRRPRRRDRDSLLRLSCANWVKNPKNPGMADWQTSPTLLNALRQEDAHRAWERFYDQYALAVFHYLRKLGLSRHQAEEVLQETMVQMVKILPGFIYDPRKRFRNFLLTVAHRKALHLLRKERGLRRTLNNAAADPAAELHSRNPSLGERDLRRWRQALFETAWKELSESSGVARLSIEVYEAAVLKEEPVEVVSQRFQVKPNAIYQIKARLTRRLEQRVRQLESDLE